MEESLHPRREGILRYLARRAGAGEPPPSVREVGVEVGLRSSQTVHHHLRKLEEEGYVVRDRGARMVRLTEKGWGVAGGGADGFARQDRRRSRAGGRGDRGGLLAGGGATRFACGQAEVSVKGGGAEHGGGEDRGRRFAGRRRG